MGEKSLSFNEAPLILVLRFPGKSQIHKTRCSLETSNVLDICLLLPSRLPDLNSANIRKKNQAANRFSRFFIQLQTADLKRE